MCYSAQIEASYRRYVRTFGAHMSIEDFAELYLGRTEASSKVKIPKAVDAAFIESDEPETAGIRALIEKYTTAQTSAFEQELFKAADAPR